MALLFIVPLVTIAVIFAVHHRRVRNRWVSPYAGFRTAAARVTRTGDTVFDIAGANVIQAH